MELYINSYGAYLHVKNGVFEIKNGDEKATRSPNKISSIIISNAATLSTDAVKLALDNKIDIVFLDEFGDPYGRVWFPRLGSTTYIRRKLLEIAEKDTGLEYVKTWMCRKIDNQIEFVKLLLTKRDGAGERFDSEIGNMETYKNRIMEISGKIADVFNNIMGLEGNTSRIYFKILSELIPEGYKFDGRSTRPAKDAFNAFLNYGYGVLYGKIEKALIIAGLDPYIGLLHTDNYNKKSLVFDFIEPYRILIDKPVFYLFSRRKVKKEHYDDIINGISLNEEGKKLLINELVASFDAAMRYKNKNIKTIGQISEDAHAFANFLIGKRRDY